MKLLLTSAGVTNLSIANALFDLSGRPFEKQKLGFIPTAANVEPENKDWLINNFVQCVDLGFEEVDLIDISIPEKDYWKKRLKDMDIILVGGGNTFHLMHWIIKSGLDKDLRDLLKTRVYVGISAGSMVVTPDLATSQSKKLYYDSDDKGLSGEGLGLVDFQVRPHLNSSSFPGVNHELLLELAKSIDDPIYAIDDQTAIKVDNEEFEIVSEGEWKLYD